MRPATKTFVERALGDLAAGYGGVMVSIGHKLGLYQAMAGPAPELARARRATGCDERYVREWLNAQVAGGYLDYHEESETYELPPEQAPVLADEDSPVFMPPAFEIPASMWFDQERTLEAPSAPARASLGRARRAALLRRRRVLPQRLPRQPRAGVAAGARRRRREARAGRARRRRRLRPRALDRADGLGLPERSRFVGFDTHAASIDGRAGRAAAGARGPRRVLGVGRRRLPTPARLRPDLLLRLPARPGRPGRAARHAYEALADDGTLMLVEPFAATRSRTTSDPSAASTTRARPRSASALAVGGRRARARGAGRPAASPSVLREAGFGLDPHRPRDAVQPRPRGAPLTQPILPGGRRNGG